MGFPGMLRRGKDKFQQDVTEQAKIKNNSPERRVKDYTPEGKPVIE